MPWYYVYRMLCRTIRFNHLTPSENLRLFSYLTQAVPRGSYVLGVGFRGNVSRKLTGFYRSTYRQDGKEEVGLSFFKEVGRKCRKCGKPLDEPMFGVDRNFYREKEVVLIFKTSSSLFDLKMSVC